VLFALRALFASLLFSFAVISPLGVINCYLCFARY